MALTITNIIPRQEVLTTTNILYTATGVTTLIDKFTVTNTGAANAQITVYLPNSGSSPATSNLIIDARTLGSRETYTCPELVGQVLPDGSFIATRASTANTLTVSASGTEIS